MPGEDLDYSFELSEIKDNTGLLKGSKKFLENDLKDKQKSDGGLSVEEIYENKSQMFYHMRLKCNYDSVIGISGVALVNLKKEIEAKSQGKLDDEKLSMLEQKIEKERQIDEQIRQSLRGFGTALSIAENEERKNIEIPKDFEDAFVEAYRKLLDRRFNDGIYENLQGREGILIDEGLLQNVIILVFRKLGRERVQDLFGVETDIEDIKLDINASSNPEYKKNFKSRVLPFIEYSKSQGYDYPIIQNLEDAGEYVKSGYLKKYKSEDFGSEYYELDGIGQSKGVNPDFLYLTPIAYNSLGIISERLFGVNGENKIRVVSAFRPGFYNVRIRGSSRVSPHQSGNAFDIGFAGHNDDQIEAMYKELIEMDKEGTLILTREKDHFHITVTNPKIRERYTRKGSLIYRINLSYIYENFIDSESGGETRKKDKKRMVRAEESEALNGMNGKLLAGETLDLSEYLEMNWLIDNFINNHLIKGGEVVIDGIPIEITDERREKIRNNLLVFLFYLLRIESNFENLANAYASSAKGYYQVLDGNMGGVSRISYAALSDLNNPYYKKRASNSYYTAINNVIAYIENNNFSDQLGDFKARLEAIKRSYKEQDIYGDPRDLSFEEQTLLFLLNLFASINKTRNHSTRGFQGIAKGKKVGEVLELILTSGNPEAMEELYLVFHHTDRTDKGTKKLADRLRPKYGERLEPIISEEELRELIEERKIEEINKLIEDGGEGLKYLLILLGYPRELKAGEYNFEEALKDYQEDNLLMEEGDNGFGELNDETKEKLKQDIKDYLERCSIDKTYDDIFGENNILREKEKLEQDLEKVKIGINLTNGNAEVKFLQRCLVLLLFVGTNGKDGEANRTLLNYPDNKNIGDITISAIQDFQKTNSLEVQDLDKSNINNGTQKIDENTLNLIYDKIFLIFEIVFASGDRKERIKEFYDYFYGNSYDHIPSLDEDGETIPVELRGDTDETQGSDEAPGSGEAEGGGENGKQITSGADVISENIGNKEIILDPDLKNKTVTQVKTENGELEVSIISISDDTDISGRLIKINGDTAQVYLDLNGNGELDKDEKGELITYYISSKSFRMVDEEGEIEGEELGDKGDNVDSPEITQKRREIEENLRILEDEQLIIITRTPIVNFFQRSLVILLYYGEKRNGKDLRNHETSNKLGHITISAIKQFQADKLGMSKGDEGFGQINHMATRREIARLLRELINNGGDDKLKDYYNKLFPSKK